MTALVPTGSTPPAGNVLTGVLRAQKDVLEQILRGAELSDALGQLVAWIEEASDNDVAGSILLLEDGERLRHCVAPHLPDEYVEAIDGLVIGPGVGSCGTAAYLGEPVVVTDIETDPFWADFRDLALPHGLRACWSTPILGAGGDVLGTFAMYYRQPQAPSETDHQLVDLCVRTAALAIQRTQVEQQDRRVRERLRLALAAGGLGAWEWDVRANSIAWDPMLESIYGMQPGEFTGDVDDYRSRIHPDDRAAAAALVEAAVATQEPYETEHRVVQPDGTVRWTHGWAAPRFDDQGLAGFTGVVADVTDRRRAEDDRERLLASEAASRAEAEKARDQLVTTAKTLQRSLLPPMPPEIPGLEVASRYHPALDGLEVGGDFYDFAPLARNVWTAIIGDVCGKGAEAAALTALVRYAARTAAIQVGAPAKVLQLVNDVMRRDEVTATDCRFATALMARLRTVAGGVDLTFATAGHPLPFVLRADGRVEQPGKPGELLGIFESIKLSNQKVRLEPGDAFIAVTDGVLEARNRRGDEFGDVIADRLGALCGMPADEAAAAIEEAALLWGTGAPRDDIAVVVLRVPSL